MNICNNWRKWIRPLVVGFYVLTILIAVPALVVALQFQEVKLYKQAWFVGGLFVALTLPISIWGIVQHLIHYTRPDLQRHIIRIIWMVPIYSIDALLGLKFPKQAIYFDTMRECYEAYVVYNFMAYLLNYLHSEYSDLDDRYENKPPIRPLAPLCCCPRWQNGRAFLKKCKHGVIQYTIVRPLLTVVALFAFAFHVYHEGEFKANSVWLYIVVFNNMSQVWAMYCLVMFYKVTRAELSPIKPVGKFLCIKAVVFFSFWQGVFIALLVMLGVIKPTKSEDPIHFTSEDIALQLQDFIICIEMFIAAVAHYYCFSHQPYVDPEQGYQDCMMSFRSMWDVSDVRADVIEHVRHVGSTVTKPLRRIAPSTEGERTPLLIDSDTPNIPQSENPAAANITIDDSEAAIQSERHATWNTRESAEPPQSRQTEEQPLLIDYTNASDDGANMDQEGRDHRHKRKSEDNISTNTVDSSTSGLNKSLNSSMNNYARFSESEHSDGQSSHTSSIVQPL